MPAQQSAGARGAAAKPAHHRKEIPNSPFLKFDLLYSEGSPPGAFARRLVLHAKRAFAPLTRDLGSLGERRHMDEQVGGSHPLSNASLNLIVWRRSTLALLLLAAIMSFGFQVLALLNSHGAYKSNLAVAQGNSTYMSATDALSFRNYTERVTRVTFAVAVKDILYAHFWCDVGALVMNALALVSIWAALSSWDTYSRSRKWLLITWLLSFASPFLISLVPTRQLVNYERFDTDSANYIDGFSQHFQLDQRTAQVVDSCTTLNADGQPTLSTARTTIGRLCGAIGAGDNAIGNLFTGGGAGRAKGQCDQARDQLNSGRVDEALASAQETCTGVLDVVDKVGAGNSKDMQFVQAMSSMVKKAQGGASVGISLYNALFMFKTLMPAAVALAPAMLRGALKVKVLVPQSSIPGMFVVILPWLYCPLVWVIYNLIAQVVGDPFLMYGLLCQAFAPMVAYVVFGTMMHVTQPMDDEKIMTVTKRLGRANLTMTILAMGGIFMFIVRSYKHKDNNESVGNAIDSFLQLRVLIEVGFTTVHKWLLTTAAGVDFMIGEIAKQRAFELYLDPSQNEVGFVEHKGGPLLAEMAEIEKATGSKEELKQMLKFREQRLDELHKLLQPPGSRATPRGAAHADRDPRRQRTAANKQQPSQPRATTPPR